MPIRRRLAVSVAVSVTAILLGCADRGDTPAEPASPPLVVLTVSPEIGSLGGGTAVGLRGYGFKPGMTVTFDGTPAKSVTLNSSILLVAIAPPHAVGAVDIVVASPDGQTSTLLSRYRYSDVSDACAGCWDYNSASLTRHSAMPRRP
jgi:hypothetical protein